MPVILIVLGLIIFIVPLFLFGGSIFSAISGIVSGLNVIIKFIPVIVILFILSKLFLASKGKLQATQIKENEKLDKIKRISEYNAAIEEKQLQDELRTGNAQTKNVTLEGFKGLGESFRGLNMFGGKRGQGTGSTFSTTPSTTNTTNSDNL